MSCENNNFIFLYCLDQLSELNSTPAKTINYKRAEIKNHFQPWVETTCLQEVKRRNIISK